MDPQDNPYLQALFGGMAPPGAGGAPDDQAAGLVAALMAYGRGERSPGPSNDPRSLVDALMAYGQGRASGDAASAGSGSDPTGAWPTAQPDPSAGAGLGFAAGARAPWQSPQGERPPAPPSAGLVPASAQLQLLASHRPAGGPPPPQPPLTSRPTPGLPSLSPAAAPPPLPPAPPDEATRMAAALALQNQGLSPNADYVDPPGGARWNYNDALANVAQGRQPPRGEPAPDLTQWRSVVSPLVNGGPSAAAKYPAPLTADQVQELAHKNNLSGGLIPDDVLEAMAFKESHFNPIALRHTGGATGLMQIEDNDSGLGDVNRRAVGKDGAPYTSSDLYDPAKSMQIASLLLTLKNKDARANGDLPTILERYRGDPDPKVNEAYAQSVLSGAAALAIERQRGHDGYQALHVAMDPKPKPPRR